MSSTTTFTVFPTLPQELQDRIWKFAVQNREGRLLELRIECVYPFYPKTISKYTRRRIFGSAPELELWRQKNITIQENDTEIDPSLLRTVIRAPIFGLLHTCRRSRELAAKVYQDIGLGSLYNEARDEALWLPDKLSETPRGWSGNYKPDMDNFLARGGLPPDAITHIKHIVGHTDQWSTFRSYYLAGQDARLRVWETFPHAETFTILGASKTKSSRTLFRSGWKRQRLYSHTYEHPPPELIYGAKNV